MSPFKLAKTFMQAPLDLDKVMRETKHHKDKGCFRAMNNVVARGLGWINKDILDPRFLTYCLVNFLYTLAMYVPLYFLPHIMIVEHGISHIEAGHIIPIYGVARVAGSVMVGMVTNRLKGNAMQFVLICMFVLGCCCIGIIYSSAYWHFMVDVGFYGFLCGTIAPLRTVSLDEMFGVETLKATYGMIMFVSGIGTLGGPPFVGGGEVEWGTFFGFLFTGGVYFFAALLTIVVLWLHKRNIIESP